VLLLGRKNSADAGTKTNAIAISLAESLQVDGVPILQEGSVFTGGIDLDGLCRVPRELDERAVGIGSRARDRSRTEQITGVHV
jgi:hypothetical protein